MIPQHSRTCRQTLAVSHSALLTAFALAIFMGLGACTENPKVDRAGVAEPTVSPTVRQAGAATQNPANSFEKVPGTDPVSTPTSAPDATPTVSTQASTGIAIGTEKLYFHGHT